MDGVSTRDYAGGKLRLEREGGVAALVFDNPAKLNAMNLSMWQALGDACEELAQDDSLRLLTLEGAGDRAFVVGADISEFGERRRDAAASGAYNAAVKRAEQALAAMPVPVLALIRGYCIGGGLDIALRCDLRLAREDARFAITPARLGLGYGYAGVAWLRARLGHAVAADLLFSGRKLSAGEALAKGICDHVYPSESFDADCAAYVGQLARNAPLTIRTVKAALLELARPEAERDPDRVARLAAACYDSEDYQEGQRAFAEKRPPRFKGR